jgi:hypothetical protein
MYNEQTLPEGQFEWLSCFLSNMDSLGSRQPFGQINSSYFKPLLFALSHQQQIKVIQVLLFTTLEFIRGIRNYLQQFNFGPNVLVT